MNQTNTEGSILKFGALVIGVGFLLFLLLHFTGALGSLITAPGRVLNKTLETENILASYEYFYDVNAQFNARRDQIKGHVALLTTESDPKERSRLSIEIAAMRQSCRDMAAKYDANSKKANKAIFKSSGLPETLQQSDCEL